LGRFLKALWLVSDPIQIPGNSTSPSYVAACSQMEEGSEWKMIPTVWLEAWRSYVDIPKSRKISSLPSRPGPLSDAIGIYLCCCEEHRGSPLLACPPPALEIK
jgi:hypothetical protein